MNIHVSDSMIITKILTSLPTRFKHFRSSWDSTAKEERPLTNNLIATLSLEDRIEQEEGIAMAFIQSDSTSVKCQLCDRFGHSAKACRVNKPGTVCPSDNLTLWLALTASTLALGGRDWYHLMRDFCGLVSSHGSMD